MSSDVHIPRPSPTPLCASFTALLPVLDEPGVDARAAAEARAHVATCAYCQAERTTYNQLDMALRRALGPAQTPHPRTEDIMRNVLGDTTPERPDHSTATPPAPLPRSRGPRKSRRVISALASLAAVLVLALLAGAFFNSRAHPPTSRPQSSPTLASAPPGTPLPTSTPLLIQGTDTELYSVSMLSPTEGWAAGSINFSAGSVAVLMHYRDGAWSEVQPGNGRLVSISMDSPTDGWAVGDQGMMFHYDGRAWQRVTSSISDSLTAVQMLSPNDGWLVSGNGGIWHYNGQEWLPQPLPAGLGTGTQSVVMLYGLSMLSPTEGWAAGLIEIQQPIAGYARLSSGQNFNGIILHYTGGHWTVQQQFGFEAIYSISMASATNGWAVGSGPGPSGNPAPFLAHYTQGRWVQAANPLRGSRSDIYGFTSVAMASPTEGWITTLTSNKSALPVLLHYTGTQWISVNLPAIQNTRTITLSGISMLSPGEGWVVGSRYTFSPGGNTPSMVLPLLLHYLNGAWSAYPGP